MYFILYFEDCGAFSSNTVEKPSDILNWGSLYAMLVIQDFSRLFGSRVTAGVVDKISACSKAVSLA